MNARMLARLFLPVLLLPSPLFAEYWIVRLQNNDRLTAEIVSLEGSTLRLRPFIPITSGDAEAFAVDLSHLQSIYRNVDSSASKEQDTLWAWDGSTFRGRLEHLDDEKLEFEIATGGTVLLTHDAIRAYAKAGSRYPDARQGVRYVVSTGPQDPSIYADTLQPAEGNEDLLLFSGRRSSRIPMSDVATIAFPGRDRYEHDTSGPPKTDVRLRDGSFFWANNVEISEGTLRLTVLDEHEFEVKLEDVARIFFPETSTTLAKTILVWGYLADTAGEFRNTVDALNQKLPGGWSVSEDLSSSLDDNFRYSLNRSRTLVIAEIERHHSELERLAEELRPLAEKHLLRGGNIVFMAPSSEEEAQFLEDAGLARVEFRDYVHSGRIEFQPGAEDLMAGLPETVEAVNATFLFSVREDDRETEVWASYADSAVVTVRRTGSGHTVIFGPDFFSRSDELDQLLANAVRIGVPAEEEEAGKGDGP